MSTMITNTPDTSDAASAMETFWENVRTILYALALALVIRATIAQPFRIPSSSMEPTLEVGDYIVVTKWSFGYGRYSFAPLDAILPHGRLFGHPPERGQIAVFRPPGEPDRDFIKRVIGVPGDRIQVTDGVLFLNGAPVPRENLGVVDFENAEGYTDHVQAYRETLNGHIYVTFDRDTNAPLDNTRVFTVPEDRYFMMGDNRDNSDDSRHVGGSVGFVPYENMIGPAQFVAASFDGSTNIVAPWTLITGFRGERFLKPLH